MKKKLLTLSDPIYDRLSEEDNASAFVDVLLSVQYEIPLPTEGSHMVERHSLADILGDPTPAGSVLSDLEEEEFVEEEVEEIELPKTEWVATGQVSVPDLPINFNGQPAVWDEIEGLVPITATSQNVCPNCGSPMATAICLNCL